MRIAITGVSSTGKTTLSKELAAKLGVQWISEGCNGAFEYIIRNNIELSTTDFTKMSARDHFEFEKALAGERRIKEATISFVADGEPLLWLSYMLMKCSLQIPQEEMEFAVEWFYRMVNSYDYIWYVPFGHFPIISDGYRIDNKFFLQAQDAILRDCIQRYTKPFNHKCKILNIESSHYEYRLEEIMRVLNNA